MTRFAIVHPTASVHRGMLQQGILDVFPCLDAMATLSAEMDAVLIDALTLGPLGRETEDGFELGADPDEVAFAVRDSGAELALVHFSKVQRLKPGLMERLERLTHRLSYAGIRIHLFDPACPGPYPANFDPLLPLDRLPAVESLLMDATPRGLAQVCEGLAPPGLVTRLGSKAQLIGGRSEEDEKPPSLSPELVEMYCELFAKARRRGWLPGEEDERAFPCLVCPSSPDFDYDRAWFRLSEYRKLGIDTLWLMDRFDGEDHDRLRAFVELVNEADMRVRFAHPLPFSLVADDVLPPVSNVAEPFRLELKPGFHEGWNTYLTDDRFPQWFEAGLLRMCAQRGEKVLVSNIGHEPDGQPEINVWLRVLAQACSMYNFRPELEFALPPDAFDFEPEYDLVAAMRERPAEATGPLEVDALVETRDHFRLRTGREDQEKLILNVSYRCNNNCVFCSVADRERKDAPLEELVASLESAYERGVRNLDLDGGEPTLYPHLFDLLDAALKTGYRRMTITSNGRRFNDPVFIDRLVGYPVDILVSLHGADAGVHDPLVQVPGAWKQTVAGIVRARKRFERVGVNMTVVSDNVHQVVALAHLAAKLGADTFNIQYYTPFGNIDAAFAADPWETAKQVREAIDKAPESLAIHVVNLPFCMLEGYEAHGLQDFYKTVRTMRFVTGEHVNLADYLAERRFKNGLCDNCRYDSLCQGFWDYSPPEEEGEAEKSWKVKLLDLIPGYACSMGCIFCAVPDELQNEVLSTEQAKEKIRRAMMYDPSNLRIGGGEPTEREDLPQLIDYAASLGFETIGVQTNGVRTANREYLHGLIDNGLNKLNISIRGDCAEVHDELTKQPGSFEKAKKTLSLCRPFQPGLRVELDVLVATPTLPGLHKIVSNFGRMGVRYFNLWMIAAEGRAQSRAAELVPRYPEAAKAVRKALKMGRILDDEIVVRSYYIPYCFLPDACEAVWHPLEENALVSTPSSTFRLDKGTLDLGRKTERCQGCRMFDRCFGAQPGYLDLYGDEDLKPM